MYRKPITDKQILALEPELIASAIKAGIPVDDAHDIVSEVIISTWENREKPSNLRGYMRRSLSNAIVDHHRARNGKHCSVSSLGLDHSIDLETLAVDTAPAASEIQENVETLSNMVRALNGVSASMQDAFLMIGIKDMSVSEYAELRGIPVGTAKSRFHRARIHIKKVAEKEGWM